MAIHSVPCSCCMGDCVYCDNCKTPASKCGSSGINDAVVWARKIGYLTVPGNKASDPMKWLCPDCQDKILSHAVVTYHPRAK